MPLQDASAPVAPAVLPPIAGGEPAQGLPEAGGPPSGDAPRGIRPRPFGDGPAPTPDPKQCQAVYLKVKILHYI